VASDLHLFTDSGSATRGRDPVAGPPMPVKILLVDDEPKNLTALETVLVADDRTLVRAASGQEALRHVLQDDFAVVLLDVHMPTMDGFETAELIRGRERSRETPIIFLTAAISGEVSVARGYSLGAVDYIIKPFDPDILRSKVNVFIELFRKTAQVKQQADALAETTTFLRSVLEGATAYAIMALDLQGRILAWNEGAHRIYGYRDEEVVGRADIGLLHCDEDVADGCVDEVLDAARREGRAVSERDGQRKGGERFMASLSIEQRTAADGRLVGYVCIAQDVTQVREAEQQRARLIQERVARAEAERARDHLRQVVDVLPEGIMLADSQGYIQLCNAAAIAIIGQAPPAHDVWAFATMRRYELDGTPCSLEELPLARAVQKGEVVLGNQLLIRGADSEVLVPVLMNSAPLRDIDGKIIGGVMAFQDITPIKELERQKDAFLAAASHDLKNPLAIVKAQAQLLMRRAARLDSPDTAPLIDGLRGIDFATRRLTGMVNELLDVARMQMGRPVDLDPRPTDLAALVRDVAADLQKSTNRHQIVVRCAEPMLQGSWDGDRIERVLVNLVSNAIKYTPAGGPIEITVGREQRDGEAWAILQVADSGIGVPAAEQSQIFERFFRASNVAGRIEGAGIGLSGVRQIVEQHGGTVAVESTEGQGSTFTVRFPWSLPGPAV
jgi:PAS domain S-box-containing protein